VLLPVHMSDVDVAAEQCRFALGRFVKQNDFRVVVVKGSGHAPNAEEDACCLSRYSADGFSRFFLTI